MTYSAKYNEQTERERARAFRAREYDRASRQAWLSDQTPLSFISRTKIETLDDSGDAVVPFLPWPAQERVLASMLDERLMVVLKARQLGISWLACGFALWLSAIRAGQTCLYLSRGQFEANELIRRTSFLFHEHADKAKLPKIIADNTSSIAWDNGSRIISLAATRDAGRSLTASLVLLDEWAFMQWGTEVLAAVKPTIDAGGKLFIVSSADGAGTEYHRHWSNAERGANGYKAIFLAWNDRPGRGQGWRDEKLIESSNDEASVLREYPATALEAFVNASGRIYDVWSDGPEDGNVTELAEFTPGAGPVFWAVDDGYSAGTAINSRGVDLKTGYYVGDSHPRVFLLVQQKPDGRLDVFYEDYACLKLSDLHISEIQALPYPAPEFASHGPGSAEIRGRLYAAGIYPQQCMANVEESIKATRAAIALDANGWRKIRVHPRCKQLRAEMASYASDAATGRPVKQFDHGVDAARYLCWILRNQ